MINNLLNEVVLDYDNPWKSFALAEEYFKLGQLAAAFTFYLRAADYSPGVTEEERIIQYKSLIRGAAVYDEAGRRSQTVWGLLKNAIQVMPERPEAYYFLAQLSITQDNYRDALVWSSIGKNTNAEGNLDIGFPGMSAFAAQYAIARWKSDGVDSSKLLLFKAKHRESLDKESFQDVCEWINKIGYPHRIPYTDEDKDLYKFPFPGFENIKQNYARHMQDLFVLSVTDGKEGGSFIEIGSGHPTECNNTALLEKEFGWKGISIDNDERMCYIHSRERTSQIIRSDASQINFDLLFNQSCMEQYIDFLRINSEETSLDVLTKIPFNKYEFGIIQFQHNYCWWQNDFKDNSRDILHKIGYKLMVQDLSVDPINAHEDWWVHPSIYNNKRNMISNKTKVSFAWDYFMKGN